MNAGRGTVRELIAGVRSIARRTLYIDANVDEDSPYPETETTYVLTQEPLEREAYPVIAREVTRTVLSVSPRHVVAIDVSAAPGARLSDELRSTLSDGHGAATDQAIAAVLEAYGPALGSAAFLDEADRPVVRWTDEGRLEFSLPEPAMEELPDRLPAAVIDACRPVED